MKRIIRFCSAILAILTVLLSVYSCKGDSEKGKETETKNETVDTDTKVTVNLDGYKIIRSETAGSSTIALAKELRQTLKTAGASVELSDDWMAKGTSPDANAKEILIGDTNRPESSALTATIEGEGWAISYNGKKLIISATRERFLSDAVTYLCESMLMGSATVTLTPNSPVYSAPYEMVAITQDEKSDYRIVRGASSYYKATSSSKTYYDTVTNFCTALKDMVKTKTGAKINVLLDSEAVYVEGTPEILVGPTNRAESAKALESVPADGYIICVTGQTVILNAWSLKGVQQAEVMFEQMLETDCRDGDLSLPADYSYIGLIGDTVEGVPTPDSVMLKSSYRGLDKTFETVWSGANTEKFNAYGTKLETAGYTLYQSHTIGDNHFTVWTKDGVAVYVSYFPSDNTLRIISEEYTYLPDKESETVTKITDSSLSQLSLEDADGNGNFGMAYVFTLEDGSYFLVDGGGNYGDDSTMLYNFLNENNKRTDGKIVIAGWLFTHEHWDHVTNFIKFTSEYGKNVTLERVYWNFAQSYEHDAAGSYYGSMQKAFETYSGVKVMKVHAGQSFWVRNINLEILYTHETLNPYPLMEMNDTSTVFRVNIAGKKVLFLGDISTQETTNTAVKVVYDLYGSGLKSDILQVGHHGWNGGSNDIYNAVLPKIALWPVEQSRWKTVSKYETSKTLLALKDVGVIAILHVAKDGPCTVTFEEDGSCRVTSGTTEIGTVTFE